MPGTLYALIVGINHYANVEKLDYAMGNATEMKAFLARKHNAEYPQKITMLLDRDATRSAIIKTLESWEGKIKNGDVCLFYFAGHGSQQCAAVELSSAEGNETLETIICADSRYQSLELADKELAYLIHKASAGGQAHFTVIMDCCHAGDNTKTDIYGRKMRAISTNLDERLPKDIHGYKKSNPYPPQSKHISLAACQPEQIAYDGTFTDSLLKVLSNNARSTYAQIITQVKKDMYDIKDQVPGIFPRPNNNPMKNDIFLNGALNK